MLVQPKKRQIITPAYPLSKFVHSQRQLLSRQIIELLINILLVLTALKLFFAISFARERHSSINFLFRILASSFTLDFLPQPESVEFFYIQS
ncbi:MAG TPA: hypothetical protein VFI70_10550 [Nitrososphaeraceae archaeon]|nr:hypothetical protein [Nitrososphaeraceae archaeon]